MTRKHTVSFIHNLIGGNSGKVWLEGLLQLCNYETYPYGYESTVASLKVELNDIRRKLKDIKTDTANKRIDVINHITSSPDLIVIDKHSDIPAVRLVEVKTCKQKLITIDDDGAYMLLSAFPKYLQYWPDALIIVICSKDLSQHLWGEETKVGLNERVLCAQVKNIKYIDTCLNRSHLAAVKQSCRELDVPNTLPRLNQS